MALSHNGHFRTGDYVCHKYMGAGEIVGIHRNGDSVFYEIRMVLGCTRVMVSAAKATEVLRPLSDRCVIEDVLHRLAEPMRDTNIPNSGRQIRERVMSEKMMRNDIREISEIYMHLEAAKSRRVLSERDRRYHEIAFRVLASEISLVLKIPVEHVQAILRSNGGGIARPPGMIL
ncbi:MAG: CarD family transcriptional regulator [bacterium JZ-2024 1]